MSMRSTARLARPPRVAPRFAVPRSLALPRRMASSHSSAPKSDMPWMLGSAVVFVPLTAWVAMYDTGAHTIHDESSGSGKDLPLDQFGNKGVGTMYHINNDAQDDDKEEGSEDGEEKEGGGEKEGGDEKEGGEEKESGEEKEHEEGGDEEKGKGEGDGGVLPSKEDVKSSIKQAVKSNVPSVAMGEEEKGNDSQGQAEKGGEDTGSEDDGAHPSEKDIRASIVQSMKSNAPEVAFAEENGNERLA